MLARGLFISVLMTLVACSGEIDEGPDYELVNIHTQSIKSFEVANATILSTRPQATDLLVDHLKMVLANHNIMDTTVEDLEPRVLQPFSLGAPTTTCPYLDKSVEINTQSCRSLVTQAIKEASIQSDTLVGAIEQDVHERHQLELDAEELNWIKGWVGEATMSGIDVGGTHSIDILRDSKACDQAMPPKDSAFKLGQTQGRALLEEAETAVLPTISKAQCNTDVIATAVYAEARANSSTFIESNPICAGYTAADLAESVDLTQAEVTRGEGVEEGMREAYETLRVRLVSTWKCDACECFADHHGKGDIYCFPKGAVSKAELKYINGVDGKTSNGLIHEIVQSGEVEVIPQEECGAAPIPVGSPLVVDLDNDGVRFDKGRIPFDLANTGEMVKMPALSSGDALLVMDLDGNGAIDSGAELFGNSSDCGAQRCVDGLEALAQHDTNRDGMIDAGDAVFAELRLWIDSNRDGRSTPSELLSLQAVEIQTINLTARRDVAFADAMGNSAIRAMTFVRTDGSSGTIPDVWFSLEFDRLPKDPRSSGIVSTLPHN